MSLINIVEKMKSLFSTVSHLKINEEDENSVRNVAENTVEASDCSEISTDDEPELEYEPEMDDEHETYSEPETDDEPETYSTGKPEALVEGFEPKFSKEKEVVDLFFFHQPEIFDSKTENFLCNNPTPRYKSYLDHTKNFDDDGIIYYQNPLNNIYEIDDEYTKMYQVKCNSFVVKNCCSCRCCCR